MANEFKIKNGLILGPSDSQAVTSITDSSSFTYDSSGLATVNAIRNFVEANDKWVIDSSNLTPANSNYGVEVGTIEIVEDSGIVSLINMSVTSGASSGTEESYSFDLDSSTILKIYSESDGSGNIQNMRVDINYDLSIGESVYFHGISESYQSKILYYNSTTGEITYQDPSGGGISEVTWGDITGSLSNQTDISIALDGKISKTGDIMSGILVLDASYQYMGNPDIDGSWRFGIDASGDLKFEKRVSGTWTYGGKFSV